MKIVLILIDSIFLFNFASLSIKNIEFHPFGMDLGIWGMPLVSAPIFFINIFGFIASYKSAVLKKFVINFNACLSFLCLLIFFYDAYPLIFPPAIFGIGLGKYIKFLITAWFFGMHSVILNGFFSGFKTYTKNA